MGRIIGTGRFPARAEQVARNAHLFRETFGSEPDGLLAEIEATGVKFQPEALLGIILAAQRYIAEEPDRGGIDGLKLAKKRVKRIALLAEDLRHAITDLQVLAGGLVADSDPPRGGWHEDVVRRASDILETSLAPADDMKGGLERISRLLTAYLESWPKAYRTSRRPEDPLKTFIGNVAAIYEGAGYSLTERHTFHQIMRAILAALPVKHRRSARTLSDYIGKSLIRPRKPPVY